MKFDKVDLRNMIIFIFIEVIAIACIGGYVHGSEKVVIPFNNEDLIETMEHQELTPKVLSIPKTEKVKPQVPKSKLQEPKKKRRVYPISSRIIKALCYKESGDNPNAPDGDGGDALGILQIHWKYVIDVNTKFGTNYTHEDMRDPNVAKQVTKLYLGYWAYHAYSQGVTITDEVIVRLHNGGPYGYIDNGSRIAINTKKYYLEMKERGLI